MQSLEFATTGDHRFSPFFLVNPAPLFSKGAGSGSGCDKRNGALQNGINQRDKMRSNLKKEAP
jgi:hypothetical protein